MALDDEIPTESRSLDDTGLTHGLPLGHKARRFPSSSPRWSTDLHAQACSRDQRRTVRVTDVLQPSLKSLLAIALLVVTMTLFRIDPPAGCPTS
jgi:hypothetical protein